MILSLNDERKWLNADLAEEDITALMKPYPQQLMHAHTISRKFIFKDALPNVKETLEPYAFKNLDVWVGR